MLFEKIQEIILEDDVWAKKELSHLYAQMEELDKEALLMKGNENKDITETAKKRRQDIPLNVAICAEEKVSLGFKNTY